MQIREKNFIFVIMSCSLLILALLCAIDEFFMADCGKVAWKFVSMGELIVRNDEWFLLDSFAGLA